MNHFLGLNHEKLALGNSPSPNTSKPSIKTTKPVSVSTTPVTVYKALISSCSCVSYAGVVNRARVVALRFAEDSTLIFLVGLVTMHLLQKVTRTLLIHTTKSIL